MSAALSMSLQIQLPESIDRRFARRIAELEGASWPDGGGHITLVPPFTPLVERDAVVARVATVCAETEPFVLHLAEPSVHPDATRPGYHAVFLTVADADAPGQQTLRELRARLLGALVGLRWDSRPEITAQPFLPHVTLALSLSEAEAIRLVRDLRADGIQAEFNVDTIWIIARAGADAGVERIAIALRSPPPSGQLSA